MMTLLELQTQTPDMSALDTLDIYLGGLEPTVRIHLLDTQNAWTLERALEESRNFAKTQGAHDLCDDPMDLTVPTPLARQAEFPPPLERSHSSSARCSNCGHTGHPRATCGAFPCSPSARPSSLKFGQHVSRSPRLTADPFRVAGASSQSLVCGSSTHVGQACPSADCFLARWACPFSLAFDSVTAALKTSQVRPPPNIQRPAA